jgi:hypothetical protein
MPSNASANRRMSGHRSTSGGIEAVGKLIGELACSGAELVSINLEARVGKEEENLPGRGRHATRTAPLKRISSIQHPVGTQGWNWAMLHVSRIVST